MHTLITAMLLVVLLCGVAYSAPVDDISNDYGDTGADRSYSFKYDAGDSYREEEQGPDGDGRGVYAFLAPEGSKHIVNYVFGKKLGFLASVGPTSHLVRSRIAVPELRTVLRPAPQEVEYEMSYSKNDDGSYNYYYNTGLIEHRVSADKDNEVVGKYSYTGQAGTGVNVAYQSGVDGYLPTYSK